MFRENFIKGVRIQILRGSCTNAILLNHVQRKNRALSIWFDRVSCFLTYKEKHANANKDKEKKFPVVLESNASCSSSHLLILPTLTCVKGINLTL